MSKVGKKLGSEIVMKSAMVRGVGEFGGMEHRCGVGVRLDMKRKLIVQGANEMQLLCYL